MRHWLSFSAAMGVVFLALGCADEVPTGPTDPTEVPDEPSPPDQPASLEACFTSTPQVPGQGNILCTIHFDASCSRGDVREYRWIFQGNEETDFPDASRTTTSPTITYSWEEDPACFGFGMFDRRVSLTVVDEEGNQHSVDQVITINPR